MNIYKLVDFTYLPEIKNIIDDSNLNELNELYQIAMKNKFRSFCTYPTLIPYINSKNYTLKLCGVIDFPNGTDFVAGKVADVGSMIEIGKRASSSECDVVLSEFLSHARKEVEYISYLQDRIGIKYIIELEKRGKDYIKNIIECINTYGAKFIKTSTGRNMPEINFNERLELFKWLKNQTEIPIKISGAIKTLDQVAKINEVIGRPETTIFGIGYNTLCKEWGVK